MTSDQVSESQKVQAALLVGMAAGLTNLANAINWSQDDQLEFAACVDLAKHMLSGGTTTELDRMEVSALVDDLMIGLVTADDAYKAITGHVHRSDQA